MSSIFTCIHVYDPTKILDPDISFFIISCEKCECSVLCEDNEFPFAFKLRHFHLTCPNIGISFFSADNFWELYMLVIDFWLSEGPGLAFDVMNIFYAFGGDVDSWSSKVYKNVPIYELFLGHNFGHVAASFLY